MGSRGSEKTCEDIEAEKAMRAARLAFKGTAVDQDAAPPDEELQVTVRPAAWKKDVAKVRSF